MFITGVNDAGYKLFTGVDDTGDKFVKPCHGFSVIAGVIATAIILSLVSLTQMNNFRLPTPEKENEAKIQFTLVKRTQLSC
jgi:hypothetical protein